MTDEPRDEALLARLKAQRKLAKVRSEQEGVSRLAADLTQQVERNHFAELLIAAMTPRSEPS